MYEYVLDTKRYILVYTAYILVCNQYILVCTSTYWYVPVHTSMYHHVTSIGRRLVRVAKEIVPDWNEVLTASWWVCTCTSFVYTGMYWSVQNAVEYMVLRKQTNAAWLPRTVHVVITPAHTEYIPVYTGIIFGITYQHVLCTDWYIQVCTKNPDFVPLVTIPDVECRCQWCWPNLAEGQPYLRDQHLVVELWTAPASRGPWRPLYPFWSLISLEHA